MKNLLLLYSKNYVYVMYFDVNRLFVIGPDNINTQPIAAMIIKGKLIFDIVRMLPKGYLLGSAAFLVTYGTLLIDFIILRLFSNDYEIDYAIVSISIIENVLNNSIILYRLNQINAYSGINDSKQQNDITITTIISYTWLVFMQLLLYSNQFAIDVNIIFSELTTFIEFVVT